MVPEPFNNDTAYQQRLQDALTGDLLDPVVALYGNATNALAAESPDSNITPEMDITLVAGNYSEPSNGSLDLDTPMIVSPNNKRDISSAAAHQDAGSGMELLREDLRAALASRDVLRSRDIVNLAKRDGWDTFFEVMGNDLVGELCELCGAISAGKDAYDAVKCLFGDCPAPPQKTVSALVASATQAWSMKLALNKDALIMANRGTTVRCANCYIEVSSLRLEGKVQVLPKQLNVPENMVLSAVFTATQSSVSALLYSISAPGPYVGGFDIALKTFNLDSITAPNVFTLA